MPLPANRSAYLVFRNYIFPLLVLGNIIRLVTGFPVLTFAVSAFFLLIGLIIIYSIGLAILGIQYGPTLLAVADFIGIDLPRWFYEFRPIIRIWGLITDIPTYLEFLRWWK